MNDVGITEDDEEQIREFLKKPAYLRDFNDLLPNTCEREE